jgi:hypothetical protein
MESGLSGLTAVASAQSLSYLSDGGANNSANPIKRSVSSVSKDTDEHNLSRSVLKACKSSLGTGDDQAVELEGPQCLQPATPLTLTDVLNFDSNFSARSRVDILQVSTNSAGIYSRLIILREICS